MVPFKIIGFEIELHILFKKFIREIYSTNLHLLKGPLLLILASQLQLDHVILHHLYRMCSGEFHGGT